MPDSAGAWECWGAFIAIQQIMVYTDVQRRPLLSICAAPETTRIELIRVYSRYAEQHPEASHQRFAAVALLALTAAYPCRQSTSPPK